MNLFYVIDSNGDGVLRKDLIDGVKDRLNIWGGDTKKELGSRDFHTFVGGNLVLCPVACYRLDERSREGANQLDSSKKFVEAEVLPPKFSLVSAISIVEEGGVA